MNETTHPTVDSSEGGSPIVRVRNVSKRFTIGPGRAGDLRERFRSLLPSTRRTETVADFWAFRDVSFSLDRGQTLGIIGHNGSGKSTLLKILTGILPPTTGSVEMHGRVGALIEVGAGFHPDLTGRENIFLNGSLLGLSRREIAERFDAIVQFAGLETFIDTPVKRYSSGMYMRLGFSIAAHTDPDILIVDEVLAVGDALFQAKCIRHLTRFIENGGTVLFVSHVMAHVRAICKTCVWLDRGEVRFVGPTESAIERYEAVVSEREEEEFKRRYPLEWETLQAEKRLSEETRISPSESDSEPAAELPPSPEELAEQRRTEHEARLRDPSACCVLDLLLTDQDGNPRPSFPVGLPLSAEIRYRLGRRVRRPVLGLEIFHADTGQHLFSTSNFDHDRWLEPEPHTGRALLTIPFLSLNEGRYRLRISIYPDSTQPDWHLEPEDAVDDAGYLEVKAGRFGHGVVYLPVEWALVVDLPTDGFGPSESPVATETAMTAGRG
ncbi:MAG: ABC transporter ATP-binding protein [Capsulimonadales bacterium]|nr:ABC transporter ATP-binding protein [Capsulimonadales bacterium]